MMPQNAANFDLDIEIEDDHWRDHADVIKPVIKHTLKYTPRLNEIDFSLSITLTNNDNIQIINKKFRNKDKPTNVLSFPQFEADESFDLPEIHLGDLVFAYETIDQEAVEQKKPFLDHFKHLITHGFLHLLGYDHIDDDEANEMEALEIEILQGLNIKNPYITQ